MAAKVSALAEEVLAKAAELPAEERALVARTLIRMPLRAGANVADRHAEIARRVELVQSGKAKTLTLEEVQENLIEELDL